MANNIGYEIVFHRVGDKGSGGDAISVAYGDIQSGNRNNYKVVLIDGGTKESASKVIDDIKNTYGSDKVDLHIITHPDIDHVSGAIEIIKELDVKKLWLHRPWENDRIKASMFKDGRFTDSSIKEKFKEAFSFAYEAEQEAIKKGIPISDPFVGSSFDNETIKVLSPNKPFYEEKILQCEKTPEPALESLIKSTKSFVSKALNWVTETWDSEKLTDEGETTPMNETSVITLFNINGHKILLTGDAGQEALTNIISYTKEKEIDLSDLSFLQVPHHGSKRNIGPTILKSIHAKTAYISVPTDGSPKHPSQRVINAFVRRRTDVHLTQKYDKIYFQLYGTRKGNSISPEQFKERYEE